MTDPVWRVAGRYRVVGRIGAGGMADVLRAHDELLNRDVAIKVFRSVPTTPDTASGVERQHAELHALARLNHPNLTVLYDGSIVGQEGPAYLVMELIEGPSLAQKIDADGLSEPQTRLMGAQIADALAYVHNAGMVHRDVKPANILLGADGATEAGGLRARLTDFGIVRLVGNEPLTQVDMTLGSASYLAPEQARGSGVGPAADVYALGLTLIETLTGVRAFDGPPLEAVVARLSNDPEIPSSLPDPWPLLLAGMTARDAGARPTATRVAQILRGAESPTTAFARGPAGAPLVTPPPPRPNQTAYLPPVVASASYPAARASASRPIVTGPPRYPDGRPPGKPTRSKLPWLIAGIVAVIALIAVGAVLLATSGSGGSGTDPSTGATTPVNRSSTRKTPSSSAATKPTKSKTATSTAPDTSAPSTSPSTPPSSSSSSASSPSTTVSSPSTTPSTSASASSSSVSTSKSAKPSKTKSKPSKTKSKPATNSSSSTAAAAS